MRSNLVTLLQNINNDSEEEPNGGHLEGEDDDDRNDSSPSSTESSRCLLVLNLCQIARTKIPNRLFSFVQSTLVSEIRIYNHVLENY